MAFSYAGAKSAETGDPGGKIGYRPKSAVGDYAVRVVAFKVKASSRCLRMPANDRPNPSFVGAQRMSEQARKQSSVVIQKTAERPKANA